MILGDLWAQSEGEYLLDEIVDQSTLKYRHIRGDMIEVWSIQDFD